MYTALKSLKKKRKIHKYEVGEPFFLYFAMGTQDYKMESMNKRHFLGTTFKDALSLEHYITKQIFIIIYNGRLGGGGWRHSKHFFLIKIIAPVFLIGHFLRWEAKIVHLPDWGRSCHSG